ncbi:unnamed protein product [Candida verbasci]|uniref:C2H2-type domain-containing protein n=1 Tax=Candida verbasci TaxID=1227364 RepID=A0A9W4XFV9_9ASCO|nr:unnamed protein product [Candida verbasci]
MINSMDLSLSSSTGSITTTTQALNLQPQPIPKKSQQIRTDKPRPHICQVCTRAFARLEHLKRHERAHTNEKPYQCAACGRCFARRDLVLRHQQKLHSDLPNIMRRNSSKDGDINENINVLHNNTDPNAPLPNNSTPISLSNSESDNKPKFKTSLFGEIDTSDDSQITLHSSNHKNSVSFKKGNSRRNSKQVQQPSPDSDTPKRKKSKTSPPSTAPAINPLNYRHVSYSAASGVCYSGNNENANPAPMVDFATPPLGPMSEDYNKILEMGGLLEWGGAMGNNIEPLDLNDDKLAIRQKSLKNLHDFFTDNMKQKANIMHQPQHLTSTTMQHSNSLPASAVPPLDRFEFTLHQPDLNFINQFKSADIKREDQPSKSPHSSTGSINPQQLNNNPKNTVINGNHGMPVSVSNNDNDWIRDLVFPPFDLNFSSYTSHEDLRGFYGSSSLLHDTFRRDTATFFINEPSLYNKKLRDDIISISNINEAEFPSLEALNKYVKLYEVNFHSNFSFIHLSSIRNANSNGIIPLLLAIASIGALYAYNDTDTLILFNLSKYHIQNFFEKQITFDNLQFKKVPIMAHQCLLLHIYISLFLNEVNMVDIIQRQIKSMYGLIKSTNFDQPLEQLIISPRDEKMVQNNFDFFIMAQSRIRTLRCFQFISGFISTILDLPLILNSSMIYGKFGDEELWNCENSQKWYSRIKSTTTQPFNLIEISNGIETTPNELFTLVRFFEDLKPFENLSFIQFNTTKRQLIETELLNYESSFMNSNDKLILSLYYLLKIKIEINNSGSKLIHAILNKDWITMNKEINLLHYKESNYGILTNSFPYATKLLQSYNYNNYNIPVFYTFGIFISILIISTYLDFIEKSLMSKDISNFELINYIKCNNLIQMMKKETDVIGSGKLVSLSMEREKIDDLIANDIDSGANQVKAQQLNGHLKGEILNLKLSSKVLNFGVDLMNGFWWPIAVGFAEGLKNRST